MYIQLRGGILDGFRIPLNIYENPIDIENDTVIRILRDRIDILLSRYNLNNLRNIMNNYTLHVHEQYDPIHRTIFIDVCECNH